MSDPVLTALFNSIIAACVTCFLAWMNRKAKRQRDRMEKTGEKTHALVNSQMTNLLRLYSLSMRRVADLSGHADDRTLANLAEEAWKKNVDSQPPPRRTSGNVFHGQAQD